MTICKESLTSLLHIDSWWVYLVLKSLTSLLYVVHVCRGSFTSPLIHYIMCYASLLHVMHMCREANLASSSSWMYIVYNIYWSLFTFNWYQDATLTYFQLISYFKPMHVFLLVFHKGGENLFFIFQLVFVFPLPCFMIKNNTIFWYQDVCLKILKIGISKFCV